MLLSYEFRQRGHEGDFSDYRNGYEEMKLCSVEASMVKVIAESESNAWVSSRITYRKGETCGDEIYLDFDFLLTQDTQDTGWRIDTVTSKESPVIPVDGGAKCQDNEATVLASSLNVRAGPGAGRAGEALYKIDSYLHRGECVIATATNADRSWVRISNSPRANTEGGWVAGSFLEFGGTHADLSSLPIVVVQSAPEQDPPRSGDASNPIGIQYLEGAEYVCYEIVGDTGPELAEQMTRLGPHDGEGNKSWAVASYKFDSSEDWCYADGTADFSDLTVTVDASITMPCWYPPDNTNLSEVTRFDSFMQALAHHELRHVEIAWQYARILEKQFKDTNTCNESTLAKIVDEVWEALVFAQTDFHASSEGQAIPYLCSAVSMVPQCFGYSTTGIS